MKNALTFCVFGVRWSSLRWRKPRACTLRKTKKFWKKCFFICRKKKIAKIFSSSQRGLPHYEWLIYNGRVPAGRRKNIFREEKIDNEKMFSKRFVFRKVQSSCTCPRLPPHPMGCPNSKNSKSLIIFHIFYLLFFTFSTIGVPTFWTET